MPEHTQACKDHVARTERTQKEWYERWPNACTKCGGYGGHTSYESVPYGPGSTDMPVYTPCDCLEEGKCPRCGEKIVTDNGAPCLKCGWDWGNNKDDVAPEIWECWGECVELPVEFQ